MMHSRKSPWVKWKCDENFDITLRCLHGAEVCDLTDLSILSKIKTVFENQNDVGLYRCDGLGILWNLSGSQIERLRKEFIEIFDECRSSITTKTNLNVIQFLNIELDLTHNTYRPYKATNYYPMYINVNSNHAPKIIKQIPKPINRRLSNLSSNGAAFLNKIQSYREALKKESFCRWIFLCWTKNFRK